jgi:lipocalin
MAPSGPGHQRRLRPGPSPDTVRRGATGNHDGRPRLNEVPEEDSPSQNGEHRHTPPEEPTAPAVPRTSPFEQPAPAAPGATYPPGYPPPAGAEPTYQEPPPWVPPVNPYAGGSSPFGPPPGPPPGPPVMGAPGLPNGSVHEPAAHRPRRRARTILVIVVVAVLALAAGIGTLLAEQTSTTVSSVPGSSSSPAANQILRTALAAAKRVGTFHYVATSSVSAPQGYTQKTLGEAGVDSGRQVITLGAQKFVVLVVGSACYLKGNAAALTANLGLPASIASAHVGQWISLARTDAPYSSVYAAVTASSALADNVTITPRDQLPDTRIDGRSVRVITGAIAPLPGAGKSQTPKGTATLAVRSGVSHLPVRYTERGSFGKQKSVSTVTFTGWGDAVNITAPSGAVSYASLGVGSGSVPQTPTGTVLT